jgi:hypothetical protein
VAFPDVELLLIRWLTQQLDDDAYVCSIGPPGDEFRDRLPLVRITRRGGPRLIRQQLDQPALDIDVWHTDLAALNALVERVRDLVEVLRGVATDHGTVTEVIERVGPQRLPEDDPLMLRAGFSVSLITRRTSAT